MARIAPGTMRDSPVQTAHSHEGELALALQEILTATVRLRANRQVAADADSFRAHVKHVLSAAEAGARRAGYADEDIRLALFAVVTFLDESVLNSAQPMFASWPRKPLQEEIFGGHTGGEIFFRNLHQLLSRQDSDDVADVLEVYQLCLLLGFQGRYGVADRGELPALMSRVADKIQRIRGAFGEFSPLWRPPPGEIIEADRDTKTRALGLGAVAAFALSCVLFVVFRLSLRPAVFDLHALVSPLVR